MPQPTRGAVFTSKLIANSQHLWILCDILIVTVPILGVLLLYAEQTRT